MKKRKYIARDKCGTLCAYDEKPERNIKFDVWRTNNKMEFIDRRLFPDLKWEDEPKLVTLEY